MTTQPTTPYPKAVKLAQQGDAGAIAALLHQSLQYRGIQMQVSIQQNCLWILLEGKQVPNQTTVVQRIREEIALLSLPTIKAVKVYGRQLGQSKADWSEEWAIQPAVMRSSRNKVSVMVPARPQPSPSSSDSLPEEAPIAEPTVSQARLMALLKMLAAVTLLVAIGSLVQIVRGLATSGILEQLLQRPDLLTSLPSLGQLLLSASMGFVAILALVRSFRRQGTHLHPKYAQTAYAHLGIAFIVNVGVAMLLLTGVSLGLVTPHPALVLPLFLVCMGFWIWGGSTLARAKGQKRAWGILGVLLLDGVVLLSLMPDQWTVKQSAQRKLIISHNSKKRQ